MATRSSLSAGEKPGIPAGVEVADEVAEAVLELDVPPARAPIVDDENAEVLERALEHASASLPRRAGGRELVERVGPVRNAQPIHATQHVIEQAGRCRERCRSLPYRYRHRFRVYVRGVGLSPVQGFRRCRAKRASSAAARTSEAGNGRCRASRNGSGPRM